MSLEDVDLLQQSTNSVGGLSTGLDPLLSAISIDLDLSGRDAGILSADLLDETAIAGIAAVSNNNAIEGSLLSAHTAQSDLNHNNVPPKNVFYILFVDLSINALALIHE